MKRNAMKPAINSSIKIMFKKKKTLLKLVDSQIQLYYMGKDVTIRQLSKLKKKQLLITVEG